MGVFSGLRQFLYPREFRIAPLKPFDLTTFLKVIAHRSDKDAAQNVNSESIQFLNELSNSFWRLNKKMLLPGSGEPEQAMRHTYTALAFIWNALMQAGITMREYTDSPYNPELSLVVLSCQEVSGINEPRVIETVKPAIFLHQHLIQPGEVIVGVPTNGS